tara:strand:- start:289 stop:1521 length:1233 start_codon:yes stop_codon:yes gene_type:complete
VLCLDVEGGHGGSSKSLFELVRHIDDPYCDVEVICRRTSHLVQRYAEMEVPCSVWPQMVAENAVSRPSRNLIKYARGALGLGVYRYAIRKLAKRINEEFDLVHFNHEGLFLLARALRGLVDVPFTMHGRTTIADNAFGRWQCRMISQVIDEMVFITENEQRNFMKLGGNRPSIVINNAVGADISEAEPITKIANDVRFKVAHLNSYSQTHGGDRVIEIAGATRELGCHDVLFVVAGHTALEPSIIQRFGLASGNISDLREYAALLGVEDSIEFLGHVTHTDRVLASCDALVSPSRLSHPWGRAIIEAMSAGLPVIATGSYDRFVKHQRNGLLHPEFDANAIAQDLIELARDPDRARSMGEAATELVSSLCAGTARARELGQAWRHAVAIGVSTRGTSTLPALPLVEARGT